MEEGKSMTEYKVGDVIYEDENNKIVVTEVKETPAGQEIVAKNIKGGEKA